MPFSRYILTVALTLLATFPVSAQIDDGNPGNPGNPGNSGNSGDFGEVFGIVRADTTHKHHYILPQTRFEWEEIAQKIRDNAIDASVSYAMARGEKPADIFTPDLMKLYEVQYEEWVVKKWNATKWSTIKRQSEISIEDAELELIWERMIKEIERQRKRDQRD